MVLITPIGAFCRQLTKRCGSFEPTLHRFDTVGIPEKQLGKCLYLLLCTAFKSLCTENFQTANSTNYFTLPCIVKLIEV